VIVTLNRTLFIQTFDLLKVPKEAVEAVEESPTTLDQVVETVSVNVQSDAKANGSEDLALTSADKVLSLEKVVDTDKDRNSSQLEGRGGGKGRGGGRGGRESKSLANGAPRESRDNTGKKSGRGLKADGRDGHVSRMELRPKLELDKKVIDKLIDDAVSPSFVPQCASDSDPIKDQFAKVGSSKKAQRTDEERFKLANEKSQVVGRSVSCSFHYYNKIFYITEFI
jgi:hypothetical protein